jgi:hypothetical protein
MYTVHVDLITFQPFFIVDISSIVARWFVFQPKIPIWVNF